MLVKRVWSKRRKRQYQFHYHITCWLKEALGYLEAHPYEAQPPARPKLDLTDEQREQRRKLIAKRHSIRQRIRRWEDSDSNKAPQKIKGLIEKELTIIKKIQELGGVPKGWKE